MASPITHLLHPPMFCDRFSPIPFTWKTFAGTTSPSANHDWRVYQARHCAEGGDLFLRKFLLRPGTFRCMDPPQKKNQHQNLALLNPGKKKALGNNSLHVTKGSTSSILLIFLPVRYKIHTKKSIGRSHLGVINISWAFCRRSCDYFMFLEIHPLKNRMSWIKSMRKPRIRLRKGWVSSSCLRFLFDKRSA